MAGFREQLQAARQAHLAATAIEDSARLQVAQAFQDWESGKYNALSIRYRLERIVRLAYRASITVAAEHVSRMAGVPGWSPTEVFNSDYLAALIQDVRRNLREYKASDKEEAARRRVVFRMQHSAGVAAQRGYTDEMIQAYTELQDFGFQLRKVWLANFVNNAPCEHCVALHGTEAALHESFPVSSELKVYGDLKGPPRHPNCKCYLAILVVSLENAFEALDIDDPGPAPQTMTTADVKRMPGKIFAAVVKTLRKIISFGRN